MYLDVADSSALPYGWSRHSQFSLAVVNQIHHKYSIRKGILTVTKFVVLLFMTTAFIGKIPPSLFLYIEVSI